MPEQTRFFESDFSTLKPFPEAKSYSSVGIKMDCFHDFNVDPGDAQSCLSISGLRLNLKEIFQPGLHGQFTANPFASLNKHYDKRIKISEKPLVQDSKLGFVEHFKIEWMARPKLAIGLELYDGATWYPDYSGLPLGASFWNPGWKQTGLSVTYFLSMLEGVRVRFVGGNGEGEIIENISPQQSFGFEFHGEIIRGLELRAGLSTTGNLKGSESSKWSQNWYATQCNIDPGASSDMGWSVRRMSVGLGTNGFLPFASGLKVGLGWHRSLYSHIDKDKPDQPTTTDLEKCNQLDPDILLIEDPDKKTANTMEHMVTGINGSYRILDSWFLGFDYESRTIRSDIPYFQICQGYEQGQCLNPSSAGNTIKQWAWSVGGGTDLTEGLRLAFSYTSSSFDQLYKKIYYVGRGGKTSRSRDLFSVRLAYNWKDL